MTIEKDNSITISGFEGIGQSPLDNFTDILGINNSSYPGIASVNYKFNKVIEKREDIVWTYFSDTPYGGTIQTASSVAYRNKGDYQAVLLKTTGTLPTGLSTGTVYWVKGLSGMDATTDMFLASSLKNAFEGTYIDFSGDGTGTHTLELLSPHIVRGWTRDKNSNLYLLDNQKRVWWTQGATDSTAGTTGQWFCLGTAPSSGSGNGIIYYKGYIIIFGNAKLDALKEINAPEEALTWTEDFVSANISSTMLPDTGRMGAVPFVSVNDDAIYFNNGNPTSKGDWRIGMLEENVGQVFNPATSSTFTCVSDVVYIPDLRGEGEATAIKEIGENLIIGTRSNEVFFWDKKSPAFTYKISLPEEGTRFIEVKNEIAYLFTGKKGNIYITTGTSVEKLLKIPETITNQYYSYNTREGDNVNVKVTATAVKDDSLLFALELNGYCYLMSYDMTTGSLTKKNISSLGEMLMTSNASQSGYISQIIVNRNNIFISSYLRTNAIATYQYALESLLFGYSSNPQYYCYNNHEAYIQTGLIPYGTFYDKKTLKNIYVSFLEPLQAENEWFLQGLKIYYRRNLNSDWTLLKTIDYETYGAVKDIQVEAQLTDIIDIQFKITLSGNEMLTPYLKYIRLIP